MLALQRARWIRSAALDDNPRVAPHLPRLVVSLIVGCGPQAEPSPDCDTSDAPLDGNLPSPYEADSVSDLACDRSSSLSSLPQRPLLTSPEPGSASYEGSRAVLELDLERVGEEAWRQFALFEWFDGDPWLVDRFDGWWCGVELDTLEGIDDCRVRAYSGIEIDYGFAPVVADLGTVMLHTPLWSAELSSDECGNGYCGVVEEEPAWNEAYGIAWSGGAMDRLLAPGRELAIDTPPSGSALRPTALKVAWSGCGDEPLLLVVRAAELDLARGDVLEVLCRVTDDGAFTIPAAAMQIVPHGWFGELTLERISAREHEVEGGVLFAEARSRVIHELARAP